ncbi:MAG: hypothetical protein AAGG47_17110 [Pseudomonadota bacterium]
MRLARIPHTAGRLGAGLRSSSPAYRGSPALGDTRALRPRARRGRGHRRGRWRYGRPYPFAFGYDGGGDTEITIVTPPPEPEADPEPEVEPMAPANPKRLRVPGVPSDVTSLAEAPRYRVTIAAEGADAGAVAGLLTDRREALIAALALGGTTFCVEGTGGLAIGRQTAPSETAQTGGTVYRGTVDLDLRAADQAALIAGLSDLPAEIIDAIREIDDRLADATSPAERNARRLAPLPNPLPGRACR